MRTWRLIYKLLMLAVIALVITLSYRYISMEGERKVLKKTLAEMKTVLEDIEQQRDNIQGELNRVLEDRDSLENNLIDLKAKLTHSEESLDSARERMAALEVQLLVAEKEKSYLSRNIAFLRRAKESLEAKVGILVGEKQNLQTRLHSLPELKKAIKEVKREVWDNRAKALQEEDAGNLAKGNHGYILKDRKSTLGAKVKIRVLPADIW